jgi:2-oxoglutarate dehydrogenase E2 component (dihydrolipoamide succinyltransferase)
MAIVEVKVPQLSESVAEATMLQWKKKVGEWVAADEILIEIETDKVVLEVPAPAAGVIAEILVADGGTVNAEQLIARIDTEGKAGTATAAPSAVAAVAAAPVAAATGASMAGVAMPAAAKLMADNNLAAGTVAGSGKDGRVTKGDVLSAVAGGVKSTAAVIPTGVPTKALAQVAAPAVNMGDRPEQRVPMTRLRARVAERLLQSQSTNAILTTFNEINMAPVMDMRKRMQDRFEKEHGCKLGFMSFFVKAAVHALKKVPVLNASVEPRQESRHQAVCETRVHHGRCRGLDAQLPAFCEGRGGLCRPAPEREPRTAARKPRCQSHPRRLHQAGVVDAGRPGQTRQGAGGFRRGHRRPE